MSDLKEITVVDIIYIERTSFSPYTSTSDENDGHTVFNTGFCASDKNVLYYKSLPQ